MNFDLASSEEIVWLLSELSGIESTVLDTPQEVSESPETTAKTISFLVISCFLPSTQ
jgi:hypothetical protein